MKKKQRGPEVGETIIMPAGHSGNFGTKNGLIHRTKYIQGPHSKELIEKDQLLSAPLINSHRPTLTDKQKGNSTLRVRKGIPQKPTCYPIVQKPGERRKSNKAGISHSKILRKAPS